MKLGDKVKAFVKIGLMKKPRWVVGEVVGSMDDNPVVSVCGNVMSLERSDVRLWEPTPHADGTFPEINAFADKNWDDLKRAVSKGMKEFFPSVELKYDDAEKIISTQCGALSIAPGVEEIKSIVSFREVPVWCVTEYRTIPATRWEPEDVAEHSRGSSANNVQAARLFVNAYWEMNGQGFWESMSYDEY